MCTIMHRIVCLLFFLATATTATTTTVATKAGFLTLAAKWPSNSVDQVVPWRGLRGSSKSSTSIPSAQPTSAPSSKSKPPPPPGPKPKPPPPSSSNTTDTSTSADSGASSSTSSSSTSSSTSSTSSTPSLDQFAPWARSTAIALLVVVPALALTAFLFATQTISRRQRRLALRPDFSTVTHMGDTSEHFQDSPAHPSAENDNDNSDRTLLAVPYSPFGAVSRIRLGPLLSFRSKGGSNAVATTETPAEEGDATGNHSPGTRATEGVSTGASATGDSTASGNANGETPSGNASRGNFLSLPLLRWFSYPPSKVPDQAGEESDELEVMFNINTAEALLLGSMNNHNHSSATSTTASATTATTSTAPCTSAGASTSTNGVRSEDIGHPDVNVPPLDDTTTTNGDIHDRDDEQKQGLIVPSSTSSLSSSSTVIHRWTKWFTQSKINPTSTAGNPVSGMANEIACTVNPLAVETSEQSQAKEHQEQEQGQGRADEPDTQRSPPPSALPQPYFESSPYSSPSVSTTSTTTTTTLERELSQRSASVSMDENDKYLSLAGWRASRSHTLSPVVPPVPTKTPIDTPVVGLSEADTDSASEEGKTAKGIRAVEFRALGYKYEQIK